MNILHLTKDFIIVNGITTLIKTLVSNDKLNNHFIASNFISEELKKNCNENILGKLLPLKLSYLFPNIISVIKICRTNKIDIIHAHHRYYELLGYFVSKVYPIKTLATVHSKVIGKKLFSYKADKIVVVGESIKRHLIEYFGISERKIIVINNFINAEQIPLTKDKASVKTELQLKNNYIIGYVGRFDIDEKGIDILVKVIPKVIASFEDIVFILIGEGKDKKFLLDNTKIFMKNVRIVNTKTDIYNYMQVFDLFVLPSRIDPFPLVMLEATYLKIPVIGSNIDGISEFINDKDDGMLFTSENVNELYDNICTIKSDMLYSSKLANKAFEKVNNHYTVEEQLKKYLLLYSTY